MTDTINYVGHVLAAQVGALAPAPLNRPCRVYRVRCNAGPGATKLRDGSSTGTVVFDETVAVADVAMFNPIPLTFRIGIFVDTVPAGLDLSVYTD